MKINEIPEFQENQAAACFLGFYLVTIFNKIIAANDIEFHEHKEVFGLDETRYATFFEDPDDDFRTEVRLVFNDYDLPIAFIVRDIIDGKVDMKKANYVPLTFHDDPSDPLVMAVVAKLPLLPRD